MLRIGNLVCAHSTKKFFEYMREFEKIENYVRRGDSIFDELLKIETNDTPAVNEVENLSEAEAEGIEVNSNDLPESEPTQHSDKEDDVDSLDSTVPETPSVADRVERFENLLMKEKLKTKGRPPKKTKQLTFNKTAADKAAKKVNKRKVKPAKSVGVKKKVKHDFINDESFSDTNEEDLESLLLDDESSVDDLDKSSSDTSVDEEISLNNNKIVRMRRL